MHIPQANFIDGKWISEGKSIMEVKDKYSQDLIEKIPFADKTQAFHATLASLGAFGQYSRTSAEFRQDLLLKLVEKLKQNKAVMADLISKEAGKPISYAKAEVERSISTLWNCAVKTTQYSGEMIPMDFGIGKGKTAYTKRIPVGPVLAIAPFNFPLNLALHKIGPALAVGCTVVVKPSPYTPLSILAFAKMFEEVGGPAGVLNVVNCKVQEAQVMLESPMMKMLSFTGSPQVGWELKNKSGKKKVALELGGNAAVYIDEDTDIKEAAKQCAIGAFLYSGQICISTQRIYVHHKVYESFLSALITETKELKIGALEDESTIVSSIIDKVHVDRIHDWVEEAKRGNAKVEIGGEIVSQKHNIYAPTILTNVFGESKVYCEEVFGPVVCVAPVKDHIEAIDKINDSDFGLQAGVFAKDINRIRDFSNHLEVGGVIFNSIPGFRMDTMPYGGVKSSGFGREGVDYAMEEMTEPRLIVY